MASSRRKKSVSTGKLVTIIIVAFIFVLVVIFGIKLLKSKVAKKYGNSSENEIQSAEVTVGSISTTVSGSGTLANQDSDEITIPNDVEITDIYVEAGDNVKAGDMLASVNSSSVVEAMSELQSEIDDLDAEINNLESDEVDSEITSGVDGRVKKIFAEEGTTLASTMYDNKALMLISLDGYMAVDIETSDVTVGDTVTVKGSDGTEYEGTVESVWAGKATIIITDDGTIYGDAVKVTYGSNTAEGTLYIHEEVSVTGYTGTTTDINVEENDTVSKGSTLLTLENTDNTVNYQTVLKKRETIERKLDNLIVIYKEGAVYAKSDGLVTSITESSDDGTTTTTAVTNGSGFGMGSSGASITTTSSDDSSDTIIAISPTDKMTMIVSVDESQILSISVGQEATVSIDSISEDSITGTITAIDKVGSSSNGVTSYSATVEIERTDNMLAGMSASATIVIEGKEDALLVPKDAVKQTRSTAYVYTSYNEETGEFGDMKEVTIGLSNSSYTEITEGVSEGETVYYTEENDSKGLDMSGFGGGMPGGFSGGDFSGMPGGSSGSGASGFPSGGFSGGPSR